MKKLFLLFAAITISASCFAQQISKEQSRQKLAEGMATFINAVKPAYQKGQTYAQFEKVLLGTWKPSAQGREVIKKAYGYLSEATSSAKIVSADSGVEIANLLAAYESVKTNRSGLNGGELFGATTGNINPFAETQRAAPCKWYQVGCVLQAVLDFVNNNTGTICFILSFFNVNCPQVPTFSYQFP